MTLAQVKAIERKNKLKILECCEVPEISGIYILTREEDGIKYAYVGQAVRLLTRLAQHLQGYQHIDLSLKKHKLWSEANPTGWKINVKHYPISELDEMEQHYIKVMANKGYQLRNKTLGGQGEGKKGLENQRPSRGYRDGLKQGYENARKMVSNLFTKHLTYSQRSDKPNKNQEKAKAKFEAFLRGEDNE